MKVSFKEADLKPEHFTISPNFIFLKMFWSEALKLYPFSRVESLVNHLIILGSQHRVINFGAACNFVHLLPLLTSLQKQCKDKIK